MLLEQQVTVAIIGGGPAGLMAAEVLSRQGVQVDLYDAMPSVGRKFLLAGVGGMNITHSEPKADFITRYPEGAVLVNDWLAEWDADALRAWADELGASTFVGSSGRVFPKEMKAAPLLRAWLHRLREQGVRIHVRHRWLGWDDGALLFSSPNGHLKINAKATLLALGGGSWAKLGSDGAWVKHLADQQVDITPLVASNVGFQCQWSDYFKEKYQGKALKNIAAKVIVPHQDTLVAKKGEAMLTQFGIEGGLIYALGHALRTAYLQTGVARLSLDLLPDFSIEKIHSLLGAGRGAKSLSSFFASKLKLDAVRFGLLREKLLPHQLDDLSLVASTLKNYEIALTGMQPMDEAISTAGGVSEQSLSHRLMLKQLPGVFCAGEMLDWDAPTGGYLLTATLASGRYAAHGILEWLQANQ
ncbi:TIGR03862 family flavoprotein [Leeia sp. TBRC 13508]|uniref:TIGR03862 family flavoprotein n=1 Tax=Leeia speluncae TaxID=2884804 RepID=A0ABS8D625_9NEIS|nr:TIGR03862 family flavoprotein [Leeia speluncae]MCB6183463.1 TIGR03862 family flavoprotein [Leeia speluncae]